MFRMLNDQVLVELLPARALTSKLIELVLDKPNVNEAPRAKVLAVGPGAYAMHRLFPSRREHPSDKSPIAYESLSAPLYRRKTIADGSVEYVELQPDEPRPLAVYYRGERIPMSVAVGDVVLLDNQLSGDFGPDEIRQRVVRECEIIAVLDPEDIEAPPPSRFFGSDTRAEALA